MKCDYYELNRKNTAITECTESHHKKLNTNWHNINNNRVVPREPARELEDNKFNLIIAIKFI